MSASPRLLYALCPQTLPHRFLAPIPVFWQPTRGKTHSQQNEEQIEESNSHELPETS